MIIVHACSVIVGYSWTMIIVQACTMIAVHESGPTRLMFREIKDRGAKTPGTARGRAAVIPTVAHYKTVK